MPVSDMDIRSMTNATSCMNSSPVKEKQNSQRPIEP